VENQISNINSSNGVAGWLAQHHYGYVISYLPAGQFPVVQGIEAGVLLLLALAFGAAALWLVRRCRRAWRLDAVRAAARAGMSH
jgi:hypothetical protein